MCLQDTHLLKSDIASVKQIWNYCYLQGTKTNSRGVAILLNNNFEHEVIEHNEDKDGNYLQLILRCSSIKINLINIYAPNHDEPQFFSKIRDLSEKESDYVIICGDFNLVLNPTQDSDNYTSINNPRARSYVLEIISEIDLVDTFRFLHPNVKR